VAYAPHGSRDVILRRVACGGRPGSAVTGWTGSAGPNAPSVPLPGNAALLQGNRPGIPGGGPPFRDPQRWGGTPHAHGPSTFGPNGLPLGTVSGVPPLADSRGTAFPQVGPHAGYEPPVPTTGGGPGGMPGVPQPQFGGTPRARQMGKDAGAAPHGNTRPSTPGVPRAFERNRRR
jgi:hypothetical protein